jgi:hypothetical protein
MFRTLALPFELINDAIGSNLDAFIRHSFIDNQDTSLADTYTEVSNAIKDTVTPIFSQISNGLSAYLLVSGLVFPSFWSMFQVSYAAYSLKDAVPQALQKASDKVENMWDKQFHPQLDNSADANQKSQHSNPVRFLRNASLPSQISDKGKAISDQYKAIFDQYNDLNDTMKTAISITSYAACSILSLSYGLSTPGLTGFVNYVKGLEISFKGLKTYALHVIDNSITTKKGDKDSKQVKKANEDTKQVTVDNALKSINFLQIAALTATVVSASFAWVGILNMNVLGSLMALSGLTFTVVFHDLLVLIKEFNHFIDKHLVNMIEKCRLYGLAALNTEAYIREVNTLINKVLESTIILRYISKPVLHALTPFFNKQVDKLLEENLHKPLLKPLEDKCFTAGQKLWNELIEEYLISTIAQCLNSFEEKVNTAKKVKTVPHRVLESISTSTSKTLNRIQDYVKDQIRIV